MGWGGHMSYSHIDEEPRSKAQPPSPKRFSGVQRLALAYFIQI
jgi:hypothetical protein